MKTDWVMMNKRCRLAAGASRRPWKCFVQPSYYMLEVVTWRARKSEGGLAQILTASSPCFLRMSFEIWWALCGVRGRAALSQGGRLNCSFCRLPEWMWLTDVSRALPSKSIVIYPFKLSFPNSKSSFILFLLYHVYFARTASLVAYL